jgi:hypothetical protein
MPAAIWGNHWKNFRRLDTCIHFGGIFQREENQSKEAKNESEVMVC